MPLKNLIAKKSEIDEENIENIVSDYVRYYVDTHEIGFTPESVSLNSEQKVLVYLTALLGWPFIVDEHIKISTKPSDLEKALAIPGGTLRPLLKTLKESHLIASIEGEYQLREGNLDAVKAIVSGEKKISAKKPSVKVKLKSQSNESPPEKKAATNKISQKIETWIKDGFFKEGKTLKQAHGRFHEQGIIVRQTSISGPLLRAVQSGNLSRKKIFENSREVWRYYSESDGAAS